MVNRVILLGNLGRDPEVRHLDSGAAVAKFSLATTESYKDRSGEWQEQTEWHEIVVWRSLAERAESQLKKGYRVYLEGKLTHRSWQDQDGNNHKTTEVVGSYFRLISKPREDYGGGSYANSGDERPSMNTGANDNAVSADASLPDPETDDDLPF